MTVEQQIDEVLELLTEDVAPDRRTVITKHGRAKLLQIVRPDEWWISTDFFNRGGLKVLGPFQSQELALEVRTLLEHASKPKTYAVDVLKGGE